LGVSTLTDLINELKNRRLVKELDPIRRPAAGRPTRPIMLDGGPWCVMGVHVDVDTIGIALATVAGEELLRESVPVDLRESDADQGYEVIAEAITRLIRQLDDGRELISVEVGLAGYISRDRGSLCTSHTFGWEDVPLRSLLEQTLRDAGVDHAVHIGMANDCQLAALFAGRVEVQLPPEMVAVYFGGLRDLGSGVLIDGEIFGGAQGGAGDVGHTEVPEGGPCWCGRTSCLQAAISPIALLTRSALLPQSGAEQMVAERPLDAVSLIADAAAAGDERVLATLTSAGEALGTVLDDMLGSLNPHAVILGGYLGVLSEYLMPGIKSKVASRIANLAFSETKILPLKTDLPRVVVGGAVVAACDAVLSEPMRLTHTVA
jgi:predicted NBD/HSP70 family sugar kinase